MMGGKPFYTTHCVPWAKSAFVYNMDSITTHGSTVPSFFFFHSEVTVLTRFGWILWSDNEVYIQHCILYVLFFLCL